MKNALTISLAVFALLLLTIAPALADEGRDEVEPNDTKNRADTIDDLTISGNMDEEDGNDWFVLEGQEGFRAKFTLTFDPDEVEVDYEILSGDEVVGSSAAYGTNDSVICDIPDTCYVHVWWWSGEGDYRIEIEPLDEECAGEDEIEPNDEMDIADLVTDLDINGYMCEDDEDWFVLDGQEGRSPKFTIYFDDGDDFEIDFEIYSGDELVEGAYDWGSGESLEVRVPGTCYVRVYYWSGEGEYTIEIEP